MRTDQPVAKNIDEYIAGAPDNVQEILEKIRLTVSEAAPEAQEKISYHIPTFTFRGAVLVHFTAYKNHIGLYPAPSAIEEFKKELAVYGSGKSTLQFPFDPPVPYGFISKLVKFRMKAILEK